MAVCHTGKMHEPAFNLSSTIKSYPEFPYEEIKNAVLGKKYRLSLNFIGTKRAQTLNQTYRKKTYVPDVLSFPLDDSQGEIYICPQITFKEAHKYNLSKEGFIAFLFIHGLLHLKGYDHGATMESLERRFVKRFSIE